MMPKQNSNSLFDSFINVIIPTFCAPQTKHFGEAVLRPPSPAAPGGNCSPLPSPVSFATGAAAWVTWCRPGGRRNDIPLPANGSFTVTKIAEDIRPSADGSAHLWWPETAKLQAVHIAYAAAPWDRRTSGSRYGFGKKVNIAHTRLSRVEFRS